MMNVHDNAPKEPYERLERKKNEIYFVKETNKTNESNGRRK